MHAASTLVIPRMGFPVWAFVVMLAGAFSIAQAATAHPPSRFVVVAGVESVQHPQASRITNYPWLSNDVRIERASIECGFKRGVFAAVDAEYAQAGPAAKIFEWSGLLPTKRNCSVHFQVAGLALLTFWEWEGERYIAQYYSHVFSDGDGKLFVANESFAPGMQRKHLRVLDKPGGGSSCVPRGDYRYGRMKKAGRAKIIDGKMSFYFGVYLDDLGDRLVRRPADSSTHAQSRE